MNEPSKLAGLPSKWQRWNKDRQCWEIWHEAFERNPNNPRSEEEYKPKPKTKTKKDDIDDIDDGGTSSMNRLMASIYTESFGGIHQPVSAYLKGGRAHLLDGHRRQAAIANLCEQNPDKADQLGWIPVSLQPEPKSDIHLLIHMMSSNNLKQGWDFRENLNHFKNFIKICKDKGLDLNNDDTKKEMADAIGWQNDRLDAMIEIVNSPTLCEAIRQQGFDSTTYKTWREIVHIKKILFHEPRFVSMLEEVLGVNRSDESFKEKLYESLVEKANYYVNNSGGKTNRSQAGAILERVCKPLRNFDFPIERVKKWLNEDIDLTPAGRSVERPTVSAERNENEARFIAIWKLAKDKATEKDLKNLMETCVHHEETDTWYVPDNKKSGSSNAKKINDSASKDTKSPVNLYKNNFVNNNVKEPIQNNNKTIPNKKPTNNVVLQIELPNKSKNAFEEFKKQIVSMLESTEIQNIAKTKDQKSMLRSITVFLTNQS